MYPLKLLCILLSSQLAVSFLDIEEMKTMKYGIEITNKPVLFSQPPLDNMVHVSSKYGQLYQCSVPYNQVMNEESKEKGRDHREKGQESVSEILDNNLKRECFYYTRGWWTYKFCYKEVIQQYHEDENGVADGNILDLGSYDSEKDWENVKVTKKTRKDKLFHQHKYVNGSLCDLTGKHRESTVKFFCDENGGNRLVKVEEPATCSYIISFYSAHLCKHPLFKPPEKPKPKEIICSPALTDDQYSKYLEKTQVKPVEENDETVAATGQKESHQPILSKRRPKKKKQPFLDLFKELLNVGKGKSTDTIQETDGENIKLEEKAEKDKNSDLSDDKKEEDSKGSIAKIVEKEAAKAMREFAEGFGFKTDSE